MRRFAGSYPTKIELFHHLDGAGLLALLDEVTSHMKVIRLPSDGSPSKTGGFEVIFTLYLYAMNIISRYISIAYFRDIAC